MKVCWNRRLRILPVVPSSRAALNLHLPQDLRLAEHHRIEPRGDPEGVADGAPVRMLVEERLDAVAGQVVVVAQPPDQRLGIGVLLVAIDLGAVAGGQDGGLANGLPAPEAVQRILQPLGGHGRPFPDADRGAVVIQSECEQVHVGPILNPAGLAGMTRGKML